MNVGNAVRLKQDFAYYMAVASTELCPENLSPFIVPAMTWIVFEVKVPWEKEKWHRIYGEWFPSSGYEQVEGPVIQVGPKIEAGLEKQLLTEEKEKGPSHKDRPFNLPLRPQPARTNER
ncbi:GyrI-like domain-containing protein [Paenibacillus sp. EZ-K15]|uniref:GyrI-like domain-containing protein n=1 Tax=Paenibacillus sp. EZ-K15 TaxID=2044275 RepID=UPI001F2BA050|nr:GyrI-like domain-containing protein [Paenibacillus sp. EZ-K15]